MAEGPRWRRRRCRSSVLLLSGSQGRVVRAADRERGRAEERQRVRRPGQARAGRLACEPLGGDRSRRGGPPAPAPVHADRRGPARRRPRRSSSSSRRSPRPARRASLRPAGQECRRHEPRGDLPRARSWRAALRKLASEPRDRYREECEADLAMFSPDVARGRCCTHSRPPPARAGSSERSVLRHRGAAPRSAPARAGPPSAFPESSVAESHAQANASYVFAGSMRIPRGDLRDEAAAHRASRGALSDPHIPRGGARGEPAALVCAWYKTSERWLTAGRTAGVATADAPRSAPGRARTPHGSR